MIGDQIDISKLNIPSAFELAQSLSHWNVNSKNVLLIAGESGSGKTHMACAIQQELSKFGFVTASLHMDDFFRLAPADNHQNRLLDLANVGPHEVKLNELNELIDAFKNGSKTLVHPVVHYYENKIETSLLDVTHVSVLIVEGTYAFFAEQGDFHLFMSRDYHQTRALREQRSRGNEVNDVFIEKVLEIEHHIISATKVKANAWIDVDFKLVKK